MLVQDKYQHSIYFNDIGFSIVKPLSELSCFIEWSNIETIIFSPNRHSEDCAQWIIYLNNPPQWQLKSNSWWLNKLTYILINKKGKKQRIRDDFNKDFYNLPEMIEKYLNKTAVINYSEDNRLPWKMLYDRYNRMVEDIYNRDGAI